MKKGKKIFLGILVFLVTSIFYREITLKNIKTKEESIAIENKETPELGDVVQNGNLIVTIDSKENEEKADFEILNSPEAIELPRISEEVLALDDKELENQISKEWEEQEDKELIAIDETIDLEEKIVLEDIEYTIKKGDTISDLSKEYKIKSDYIYANNVDKNLRVLQIGKKINIPTEQGIFYSVKKGDTFEALSKRFEVDVTTIKEDNNIDRLLIGAKIFLREPKVSRYLNSFKQQYVKQNPMGSFANPLVAMSLTSSFGSRKHPVLKQVLNHAGIDLRAKTGTKVVSARDGVVSFAGRASGYGKLIIIKHSDGYETRYAHLSKIDVQKGQKVSQNQHIALSGATGRVSGPHLHFEIRKNGKIENPLTYLKF
ncbi:M23 family metallopeptidase [Cetobacterium sp. ZWU0022]|uniref:M23 family metallopeptidase n=1 Tax=Cetobacterium sp. ZWU0022 TaxID=1340502 RepID=UPI00068B9D5C|nr:M23 family metallopeptidase [Cetobacterium sp. ZWU0022]